MVAKGRSISLPNNFIYQIYRSDLLVLFMVRNFYRSNLTVLRKKIFCKESMVKIFFLTFPTCFWIPIIFSNCSNLLDLRNLQEQVKKAFCYQKLFWPFTVWINCSSDLKNFENSRLSASNFKSFLDH